MWLNWKKKLTYHRPYAINFLVSLIYPSQMVSENKVTWIAESHFIVLIGQGLHRAYYPVHNTLYEELKFRKYMLLEKGANKQLEWCS